MKNLTQKYRLKHIQIIQVSSASTTIGYSIISSLPCFPPSLSFPQRLYYLKMSSATLSLIYLPPNSIPLPLNSNNYPIFLLPVKNLQRQSLGQNPKRLWLSAKFSSVSGDHHPAPPLLAGDILRKLAVSSVILLGLGLSRCAFACTLSPPPVAHSGDHHVIEGDLWFYFGFVYMFT